MRRYAQVSPRFWTGPTGRRIRKAGKDPTILAAYLMTSPASNMVGLYYCPSWQMAGETPLTEDEVVKALEVLDGLGFARYDDDLEVVYVRRMVRWQVGDGIKVKDSRRKAIAGEVQACPSVPLRRLWLEEHAQDFHISSGDRPTGDGLSDSGDRLSCDAPHESDGRSNGSSGEVQGTEEGGAGGGADPPDRGGGGGDERKPTPLVPAPAPAPAPLPVPVLEGPGELAAFPPKVRQMKVIVVLVQLAELAGFMGCTQDQHPVKSALERINDGAEPHEVVEAMRQAVEAKVPRGDMREMFFKQAWERRGGGQKRRRRALTGSAAAARKAWEEMQDD